MRIISSKWSINKDKKILDSITKEKISYLKKRRKEIEELRKIHGSEYVRKMDAEIDMEEFVYGLL